MKRWVVGNLAGRSFTRENGDVVVARHVTNPLGVKQILVEVVGFRDGVKCVLDREIKDMPNRTTG